jgi:phosphatidylserine/phosphatidylglycerophosphate/cardiolipin synthase-like enzyme
MTNQNPSSRKGNIMKPTVLKALSALCIIGLWSPAYGQPQSASNTSWQVYFSPTGGATTAICRAMSTAKSSILVQAYSFTSAPIAEALVKAHKRGINVHVILDKSQKTQKYSSADFLANSGIPTRIDDAHAIAHNKVMIIDNEIVITGSFNFTKAAEDKNAENLLIIHSRQVADQYAKNWHLHERHSEPYVRTNKNNQRPALPTKRTRPRTTISMPRAS